jgi:CubicO group peptidase (beta-lactamase class C family)
MRWSFTALMFLLPGFAAAAPPAGFDARVEAVMHEQGVPGVAVAIVEDGETTLARGYGLKSLEHPQPVGPDSLFQIGSTSKAFTAAALAILVDEGRIRWEDPVIDHLPGFRMYDLWGAARATSCTSPPRPSAARRRCGVCAS